MFLSKPRLITFGSLTTLRGYFVNEICDEEDISCEEGLHWRDGFLAKFYDQKQEMYMNSELSKPNKYLTEEERALIKRHRGGVGMLVGLFSMGIWLLDRSLQ